MNKLINKDNGWIIHLIVSLYRLFYNVEHMTANYLPASNGECFITDK